MMGISVNLIKKAILEFKGVQEDLIFIFEHNKSIYYDDYAHHPTEINELKCLWIKKNNICFSTP